MALGIQTHDDVPLSPDGGTNVLVLVPSMDTHEHEACGHLLSDADTALLVSVFDTPDERLEVLRSQGVSPDRLGIVCADEARGATATAGGSNPSIPGLPQISTVQSPGDLTGMGMRIGEFLSSWDDVDDTALCFHSLTPLLQHVEPERAFRFLHVLTQRAALSGVVAHYHMDPEAHDQKVIAMMRSLCDVTLERRDGEWATK